MGAEAENVNTGSHFRPKLRSGNRRTVDPAPCFGYLSVPNAEPNMRLPFTLDCPLVFLDLETTGLSTSHDRIVELAIIKVAPGGDVLERVRRFNPGMPIPAEATAVHGITDDDVRH